MQNEKHTVRPTCGHGRRVFLKLAGAATVAGFLPGSPIVGAAHADALTKEQRDSMTPDQILEVMERGNERFRTGERKERSFLAEQRASAKGQYPAAMILSCIDSRAPAEVIMDLGLGDIFNARVAGNISNPDILGSMEFATKLVGAKVVLVMGHTACGAIRGAIDGAELGNLTQLLAKIRPAVAATKFEGERTSKNPAFVDAVARKNVELTVQAIRENSAVIRELETADKVDLVGGMYDVETARLEIF